MSQFEKRERDHGWDYYSRKKVIFPLVVLSSGGSQFLSLPPTTAVCFSKPGECFRHGQKTPFTVADKSERGRNFTELQCLLFVNWRRTYLSSVIRILHYPNPCAAVLDSSAEKLFSEPATPSSTLEILLKLGPLPPLTLYHFGLDSIPTSPLVQLQIKLRQSPDRSRIPRRQLLRYTHVSRTQGQSWYSQSVEGC